jgi:hypothetical protein
MPRTSSTCESMRYSANPSTEAARNNFGRIYRFKVTDIAAGTNVRYTERYRVGRTLS